MRHALCGHQLGADPAVYSACTSGDDVIIANSQELRVRQASNANDYWWSFHLVLVVDVDVFFD